MQLQNLKINCKFFFKHISVLKMLNIALKCQWYTYPICQNEFFKGKGWILDSSCQWGPSINMVYHTLLHHLMVLLSHQFNEAFPTELSQQWEKLPTIKTHLQFHAWLKHVHISERNTNQLNEKKFSNMMNHQTR